MKWKKFTLQTTTEAVDHISSLFDEIGIQGIEVEDNVPLTESETKGMFIDILPELPPDDGSAKVSFYLDDDDKADEILKQVEEGLEELRRYVDIGEGTLTASETEDKDWINNWKEFFHPFRLEDNIVIQPTWTEIADAKEDDIVIHIDPGTAFGTGSHETTKLCISNLKKYIRTDGSTDVMDAGCGSGILSIIALKLGARKVYGIDIDELAVKASKENLALNDIPEEKYTIVQGNVIEDKEFAQSVASIGKYDIVVANILADVIIPLSAEIRPFMKENGVFITSGIIDMKEQAVKDALLQNGFEIIDVTHMGEWVSIVAK